MKYNRDEAFEVMLKCGLDVNTNDVILESLPSLVAELAERTNEMNTDLARLAEMVVEVLKLMKKDDT